MASRFARLRKKKKRTHGGGKTRGLGLTNYVLSTCFIRFCLARVLFCTSPAPRAVPKVASKGARDGAVVRALASHQCGPGSTPGVDAICGLSLLLVLSLAPRGFSPGTPVFPSPQKPTLPDFNSIWNARKRLNELIGTPGCFVGKQAIYNFFFFIALKLV